MLADIPRIRLKVLVIIGGCLAFAVPLAAQDLELWLNAGAAHARPPADLTGARPGTYGLLSMRAALELGPEFSLDGTVFGGRSTNSDVSAATWLGANGSVAWRHHIGPVSLGIDLEAFGLNYTQPYRYRAFGAAVVPRVSTYLGNTRLVISGRLRRGQWQVETVETGGGGGPPIGGIFPPNGSTGGTSIVDGPLRTTGLSLRLARALGPAILRIDIQRIDAENGSVNGIYRGAGGEIGFPLGSARVLLAARLWQFPDTAEIETLTTEVGYRAGFQLPLGQDFVAHAMIGRDVADPLYGTSGTFAASAGISWRIPVRTAIAPAPVVEVAAPADSGPARRVRFHLRSPDADRVALVGDFSDWSPRPMHRDGDVWVIQLTLAPGVYHFGFLVDGERWFVPDDAPGIVEDGWGRRNATLVIQPE